MQALPDSPESLCIAEMGGTEGRDGEPGVQGRLYLNIGMFLLNKKFRPIMYDLKITIPVIDYL